MPSTEVNSPDVLVIKLKNGYNMGVDPKGYRMEKLGSRKAEISFPKTAKMAHSKSLPDVSLLYTGGTIGSRVDYATGGVYMLTKPEELLHEVPELEGIANLSIGNLMSIASEDMSSIEWQKIAQAVTKEINGGARGVMITHGTDTMHYTAAALSFMLTGLNAPVVITGAQRSPDRGSSDAFMNMICSAYAAAKSDIAEVGICMHNSSSDDFCSYIRGSKARKMHTSRRDAFKAINEKPIAYVAPNGEIRYNGAYKKTREKGKIVLKDKFESKVASVKIYPDSNPEIIGFYTGKGYKGLIIEGTGLGHAPVSTIHKELNWLPHIKAAVDEGVIVGMASQCIYGRVHPNVYRNLRLVSGAGAIYCEDMTPETALVKLGWLLGNYKKEEAGKLLNVNIAGEITGRTEYEELE